MGYDRYNIDSLLEQIQNPEISTETMPSQREGIMPTAFEALGQTAWGFTSGAFWSLPEIADMTEEAATGKSNRLENFITSLPAKTLTLGQDKESYSGDFTASARDRELTLPGKIGYTVGSAVGMLVSFGWLGKLMGGGVKATAKGVSAAGRAIGVDLGEGGLRTATKLAQTDITETFGKVVYAAGQKEGAQELTEEVATDIATSALDIVSKSGAIHQAHKKLADGFFQRAAKEAIKEEALRPALGNIDDALLTQFADEAFQIALKRSPSEGKNLIDNAALNLAKATMGDTNRARVAGGIIGASAYDAILGTVVGAVRGLGEYKINESYNWENPEDSMALQKSALGHMLETAGHEAAIFSILGPVKFIRGGSRASSIQKTKDMTRGVINSLRPVSKMTPKQLETNAELLNTISKGNILIDLGYVEKGEFWKGISKLPKEQADEAVKELRGFLTKARKHFLNNAPEDFLREVGADMFQSLPRMMVGAVAMNLTSLHQQIKHYGVKDFMDGFGATDYEKVANIMTAMYFTRTPHSFNLHGAPYPRGPFETGKLKEFASQKGKQFSETVTGLNLIGGKNFESALQIAQKYGGLSDINPEKMGNKIYSKSFEGSQEIQSIKETIEPHTVEKYVLPEGQEAAGGLRTAGAKYIAENIKDPTEKTQWRDRLSIAQNIVEFHNANSTRVMDISQSLTKEAAANLIKRLSETQFDGRTLTKKESRDQLNDWYANRIAREANVPMDIIKQFVIDMYTELGVPNVREVDGKIIIPKIGKDLFTSYLDGNTNRRDGTRSNDGEAFLSLVEATRKLESAGIVRFAEKSVLESASTENIKNSINIKETAVNKMMQYVYGDGWEAKGVDYSILRQDPWYVVHTRLSEASHRLNVERVLKGSGDHSLDENSANQLYKGLRDELSGNRFPDVINKDRETIDDVAISPNADLATAHKDMKRVHKLINLVKPENNSGTQKTISDSRLLELHKQWSTMLGDAVTNDVMYENMQRYLVGKSIKTLGISRLSGGYNMHAAVHELVTNREFMRETGMQIPEVNQVNDMLSSMLKSKQINQETYDGVKEYYEKVVGTIQDARLGSIQIRNMVEQVPGAWYEAIRSSMLTGKGRASQFAVERITEVIDHFQDVISETEVFGLELRASAAQRGANTVEQKKLKSLYDASQGDMLQAVRQFKSALDSGDGLMVHAFESRMTKISDLLELVRESSVDGTHAKYTQEILRQAENALSEAHRSGWTEQNVMQEAHKQMERFTIAPKDQMDVGLRVSSSQFAQRYNLNITDMTDMFLSYKSMSTTMEKTGEGILRVLDKIDPTAVYNGVRVFTPEQVREIQQTREYVSNVIKKSGTPDPANFWQDIVQPLMTGIKYNEQIRHRGKAVMEPEGGWNRFNQRLLSDISSITTAYFSSMPIKQYTYRSGRLELADKQVGYTEKHGIQGVISALNATSEISLLSNSFYIDSKYVSKPSRRQMDRIIKEIESGEGIPIEMANGFREFLGDKKKVEDHARAQGNETIDLSKQRFKVIAADESTLMLVRIGRDNRIGQDLLSGFRRSGEDTNGNRIEGGHLYEKLQASLDQNQFPSNIRELVDRINEGKLRDNDIHDAVVLTRLINDRPSLIRKWAEFTPEERKKTWKYLKLSEMKNGFVGHEENLARVRSFLEGAAVSDKSGFFNNVLEQARIFLPKDKNAKFPKLKILSVADEMVHEGKKVNIFSSIDHKKAELTELKNTGVINERTYNENIKNYEQLTKSIVDGETFLSKRAFVANLAMMGGISPDMISFNPDGSIKDIKVGGIKPTISHTDIKTDMADMSQYGRVKEFYAKTAFKYNPEFDALLSQLGVDAITFNSSNKINEFRNNKTSDWYNTDVKAMESTIRDGGRNVHASLKPIENFESLSKDFGSVSDWLSQKGNLIFDKTNISEIPFESINLKSLGQPHDPLVGSNLGVHLHHNVGIKEWINLDAKLKNVYDSFQNYVDPYYATRLAKDLFAHSSETGDMTWLNTGIDHFLKHDGLLTSPWQRTKIEEKIIPYFMNNGMIAAGRVPEGSLDVMTADMGGLKTSVVRTEADGTKSVQLYGEFLQSKHSAEKPFKLGGGNDRPDVQSVIIQRVKYSNFGKEVDALQQPILQQRTADVFMVKRGAEKYLVAEGKGIDKDGNLRDIYNDSKISYQGLESDNKKAQALNRNLFKQVEKKENDFLARVKSGSTYSEAMTELYQFDNTMAIGSINNRQPRNQAGDLVISRLKAFEGKDGRIITHNGDLAGNSSRMNHSDAINPQDADYDMDKSSSFLAAPNRLWAEAARLSGYRTVNDIKGLNAIADQIFSKADPKLFTFEGDPQQYKGEMNATDLARGRFVKMHQTLTYLHNIYRESPLLIQMRHLKDPHRMMEVRLNVDKLRYFDTVDEVSSSVKLFLDMYKQNPKFYTENPDALMRELFFGFNRGGVEHKGLFELRDLKDGSILKENINYQSESMKQVRDDIYYGLISPINKYLRYNKGTTVDETNRDMSATLQDYQRARQNLMFSILPKHGRNHKVIKGEYDNSGMYESANNFFDRSQNPFDFAMKELNSIANKTHSFDESRPSTHRILEYIDSGRVPNNWTLPNNIPSELSNQFQMNRIAERAMREMQMKSGDIVQLEFMSADLRRINRRLEDLNSLGGRGGDIQSTGEYQKLVERKIRTEELKSIIEERLSYDPGNSENTYDRNPARKKVKQAGAYTNYKNKPVVIVNKSGETKEVVLPGKSNVKFLSPSDKLVINGHRYEIVEGEIQMGLRADYKAFGGQVKYIHKDGRIDYISTGEQTFINAEYGKLKASIADAYTNLPDRTQASLGEYAARRTALVLDKLASPDFADNPIRQFALLARMLRPRFDETVSPIETIRFGNHSRTASIGSIKYIENNLAKTVYNTLAQVANGSVQAKGGLDKISANELLRDFINMSRNHYVQERTGIEVDMRKVEKGGFTEPTELPNGFMTDAQYLNKGIFQLLRDGSARERQAAGIMYDYMSGKKLVDSATLYRASKEMERSGIGVDQQFMMKVFDRKTNTFGDVEVRNFGVMDAYRGRNTGQGGTTKESTKGRVEDLFKCLNLD